MVIKFAIYDVVLTLIKTDPVDVAQLYLNTHLLKTQNIYSINVYSFTARAKMATPARVLTSVGNVRRSFFLEWTLVYQLALAAPRADELEHERPSLSPRRRPDFL